MKKYKIPVTWEMSSEIEVEAESLEDAIKEVQEEYDGFPSEKEQNYIDGSWQVNKDFVYYLNGEEKVN